MHFDLFLEKIKIKKAIISFTIFIYLNGPIIYEICPRFKQSIEKLFKNPPTINYTFPTASILGYFFLQ